MSESTFPFDAGAGALPPEEEERGSRRVLLLAGGAVGALALAVGGWFLVGGADSDELPVGVAPVLATGAVPTPTAPPVAAALPRPFEEDLGRNPFKALYVLPAAQQQSGAGRPADPTLPQGAAPAAPAPAGPGAAAPAPQPPPEPFPAQPAPAQPPAQPAPAQPAPTQPPAGDGAQPAPAAPAGPTDREHRLVLTGVRGEGPAQRAAFTVDGRAVQVPVGGRFGPTSEIRLISVQEGPEGGQWTAVLQVGDGEPFDVVTGQAVSVR